MIAFVAADIETALIGWLKRQPAVREKFGSRVFGAFNEKAADALQLVVNRIGGGPAVNLTSETAQFQLDVWAKSRAMSRSGALVVTTALSRMSNEMISEDVYAMGAQVDSGPAYYPDPSDGTPRYAITARVVAGASPAAG